MAWTRGHRDGSVSGEAVQAAQEQPSEWHTEGFKRDAVEWAPASDKTVTEVARDLPDRATAGAAILACTETFYDRRRLRKHPRWGCLTPHGTRQRHRRPRTPAA
ncbi:hypothetical protein [Streptomyces sp. enrichment culture]|uniref:hypothetical protein n=1 Tax=Streptomyces sp. enrichment culture TaxID=1795815 RepID=UPI003F5581F3